MPTPDDFTLLRAWRGGDRQAGDTLMRRHYDSVLRFFELKVTAVAEDLTQRTFFACVEGREKYRGDATFKSYLFGIARKMVLKHLDSLRRSPASAWDDDLGGPTVTSLSTVVARREEQVLLLRALASLGIEFQIALSLHYLEGLKSREIGAVLEIPTSTVTSRLSRGRTLLREAIGQIGRSGRAQQALLQDIDACARSLVPHPGLPGV